MSRSARSRVVLGFALPIAILGLGAHTASAEAHARKVSRVGSPDAEVFLKVRATRAEVSAVQSKLAGSPLVKRFAYLSKDDAYAEFRRIFANDPDVTRGITPEDLPESFRVKLRHQIDATAFVGTFRHYHGVTDVSSSVVNLMWEQCMNSPADLEVDMRTAATVTESDHVEQWLRDNGTVASVHRFSSHDALNVWSCIVGNRGPKRTLDEFPVSFRVVVQPGTDVQSLQRQIAKLPGVVPPPGRPHYL